MPQPRCFMVMPYGIKDTGAQPGKGPAKIDFDAHWRKASEPFIRELGYDPVRADQDIGALIIHEMLERLYFADLVLADMTLPNGNIYVETEGADTWKMDTTINDLQRTVEQTRDEEKRRALQQLVEELRVCCNNSGNASGDMVKAPGARYTSYRATHPLNESLLPLGIQKNREE